MELRELESLLGAFATWLDDKDVVEISLNPNGQVYVEYFGEPARAFGEMKPADAQRFIRSCASETDDLIDRGTPVYSGRIPGTPHRIEAWLPPVVDNPMFSIRRHRQQVVPLAGFAPDKVLRNEIKSAIAARKNIIVAGSTSSGKTTLTNSALACLGEIAPATRAIVLEDTPELIVPLGNLVQMRSVLDVTLDRLLVSSLRLAPDRIFVGEVRTGIVLMTLLKAWNTGHPGGITTLHANSAGDVLPRLQALAAEVTEADQTSLIASALDLVLFVERTPSGPRISQLGRPTPRKHPVDPFSLEISHVQVA